jgi:hypothetical protein
MLAGEARGQAEALVPKDPWAEAVLRVSQVLAEGDAAGLVGMLAEGVEYRSFDAKTADAVHLLARTRKGTVVFAEGYRQIPQTLAGDIARSLHDTQVPEAVKRHMIPMNEAQTGRANATAEQWIHDKVEPKPEEMIGVIVMWCEHAGVSEAEAGKSEMVFVLVKADKDETAPRVRMVVFGDPQRKGE